MKKTELRNALYESINLNKSRVIDNIVENCDLMTLYTTILGNKEDAQWFYDIEQNVRFEVNIQSYQKKEFNRDYFLIPIRVTDGDKCVPISGVIAKITFVGDGDSYMVFKTKRNADAFVKNMTKAIKSINDHPDCDGAISSISQAYRLGDTLIVRVQYGY